MGTAHASYVGVGWVVPDAIAGAATLANANAQAGNNDNVTFTVTGLNFSSFANPETNTGTNNANFTISSFLNSQGSLTGSPVFSGAASADLPLFENGKGMLFQFTGVANFVNGMQFQMTHDDGAQFYVGCTSSACTTAELLFDHPQPTGPVTNTFTYTGPTGNLAFTFIYGECCSAPGVFQTTLVPAVTTFKTDPTPEPGGVVFFGTMAAGLFGLIRRKRAQVNRLG